MDVANMVYNRYLIDPYMSKKEQSKLVPVGDNYVIYHKLLNYEVDGGFTALSRSQYDFKLYLL